jgi:hypothetical protein
MPFIISLVGAQPYKAPGLFPVKPFRFGRGEGDDGEASRFKQRPKALPIRA